MTSGHVDGDETPASPSAEDVRERFWPKLRRFAARLPFAEDAVAAYYCAFDASVPFQVRATLLGALAYFLLPIDTFPDLLPMLGFADDASVLTAAIAAVGAHIGDRHRRAAREALARAGGRRASEWSDPKA